ncbi:hypothetical protein ZOSMA_34G00980 [Zostera marina]|uniref:Uncharacterized protein n=1 Tax=Zostera marina TaxID=29655 RepID=A0A0K9P730_ZOSMR|nr:hypothetical protein ZOSMA_34G00980 [Zostera marina]
MTSGTNGRRHQLPPSFTSSISSLNIPFSWETLPGVPKPVSGFSTNSSLPLRPSALPLPPHLHGTSLRGFLSMGGIKRTSCNHENGDGRGGARFVWDPFAIALAECTKEKGVDIDDSCHKTVVPPKVVRHRKSTRRTESRLGFWKLEFYGSCKAAACSVVESADKAVSLSTRRSSRSRSLSTSSPAYRMNCR